MYKRQAGDIGPDLVARLLDDPAAAAAAQAGVHAAQQAFYGNPRGLGAGDVKLAVSLGLMAGIVQLIAGFLVASIGGALVLVVLIATRRIGFKTAIPFGPILLAAGMCAALVG